MTKEEAVRAAIHVLRGLEQTNELQEIIGGLEKFEPMEYRRKWTKGSIYEAVKLWITLNGRCPSTKELEWDRSLPGAFVIHREYGMSGADFLRTHFKDMISQGGGSEQPQQYLTQFQEEFCRIVPCSAKDYNLRRKNGIPTWNQTARVLGVSRWTELLLLANVDISCLRQISRNLRDVKGKTESLDEKNYQIYRRYN